MRMMNRLSRASWAKMTNPAGWWSQSPKWYSSTWRGFGTNRWSPTNWLYWDGRMQPTTSVNEIWSMARPNWGFWQSFSRKRRIRLQHLHIPHLESLWRVLTLSPEYSKGCKGLLDPELFTSGWVWLNRSPIWAYQVVSQLWNPNRQLCWKRSQLHKSAFAPAYSLHLIPIYISDSDENMVTAPASAEE